MKNESLLWILGIIIVVFLVVGFKEVNSNNGKETFITGNSSPAMELLNIPSKCYSTLQPSSYFGGQMMSPISTSIIDGSIKIYPKGNKSLKMMQASDTGSMRPTIPDFSEFITINAQGEKINVGDIVGVNMTNYSLLHRVVRIEYNNSEYLYVTKGDNNPREDATKWTRDKIIYKVVGVVY